MYKMLLWLVMLALLAGQAPAASLNDAFNAAQPGAGYDRLVILEPGQTYTCTAPIVLFNEKVAIWGNGAVIDLKDPVYGNSHSIIAVGKGSLDADRCIFMNGSAALNLSDEVQSTVTNCVFFRNTYGIQHFSTMAPVRVFNTIFVSNGNAVYTQEENLTYMAYNVAYKSKDYHFVAGCGS